MGHSYVYYITDLLYISDENEIEMPHFAYNRSEADSSYISKSIDEISSVDCRSIILNR